MKLVALKGVDKEKIGNSPCDRKSLLLGPSEGTTMRAAALKQYIEDQQASNRTVYPSYDLEEKLRILDYGLKSRGTGSNRQPASH